MKQIGQINLNQTSLTTSSGNTLPSKELRPPEERAQLSMVLRQCFDLFNTYGRDPSALKSMLPTFEELLAPYPTDKVLGAFKEHLKTKPTMPTPSDILAILDWDPLPKSSESKAFERKAEAEQRAFERYNKLTPEEKAKHDQLMAEIKAAANPDCKIPNDPGEVDYSHWNSMGEKAKELAKIKPPRGSALSQYNGKDGENG